MNTLHILCNPNKPVNINDRMDAFGVAIVKFAENMKLHGWNCVLYAPVGSQISCEFVNCLPFFTQDSYRNISEYNKLAGQEISKRKKSNDMIMCFHGWENKEAASINSDLYVVEPSIGYDIKAIFAPYRAFTSYAQMHMFYGYKDMLMNPGWFDTVIPNAISIDEFEYKENKEDYVLIFGRVIENKGIHLAIQATEKTGDKLVIAGPGSLDQLGYKQIPKHVTHLGLCDVIQRKKLMADAKAIIGPTYYVEPFGNMVVEGFMSGTPAITTDWGGFTDTVLDGLTGFRCREFRDFVAALTNIDKIKPINCRNFAVQNFSDEVVHKKFDIYFRKILENNFYRA